MTRMRVRVRRVVAEQPAPAQAPQAQLGLAIKSPPTFGGTVPETKAGTGQLTVPVEQDASSGYLPYVVTPREFFTERLKPVSGPTEVPFTGKVIRGLALWVIISAHGMGLTAAAWGGVCFTHFALTALADIFVPVASIRTALGWRQYAINAAVLLVSYPMWLFAVADMPNAGAISLGIIVVTDVLRIGLYLGIAAANPKVRGGIHEKVREPIKSGYVAPRPKGRKPRTTTDQ